MRSSDYRPGGGGGGRGDAAATHCHPHLVAVALTRAVFKSVISLFFPQCQRPLYFASNHHWFLTLQPPNRVDVRVSFPQLSKNALSLRHATQSELSLPPGVYFKL